MTTTEFDGPQPDPMHAAWFSALGREIKEDYDTLHREALDDLQRAGHGGESTWVRVLNKWLPPAYTVVTRKYIMPEVGNDMFETDIVILRPSYPVPLHTNEKILSGGVAAAFSVKLTLDAAGIRDGIRRAAELRRALRPRIGTPLHEMAAPFPVGLLAHSHDWKLPGSDPARNVTRNFQELDQELAHHPRESLDYLCVSDLGTWSVSRMPYMPPSVVNLNRAATSQQRTEGAAYTSIQRSDPDQTSNAVGSLITHLIARLSYYDSTMLPLADNLVITGALGSSSGDTRIWNLGDVFTDNVRKQLPTRGGQDQTSDWRAFIF